MSLWAIVPVKSLQNGKTRLQRVLSEEARAELNRSLLMHTLEVLQALRLPIEQILVTSPDAAALAMARRYGARTLHESHGAGLNQALSSAILLAKERHVHGVLILPIDLPQMQPEDVKAILYHGQQSPVGVIVPDRRLKGTNALFLSPPDLISPAFGEASFQHHSQAVRESGARLEILILERLAFDLDTPEDLIYYHEILQNSC
jgi:2-phospho-L-lactate guanylyltransferase